MKKWLWKLKKRLTHQAVVLMYHRIGTTDTDPWELAVSPQNFEQQLQLLARMGITTSANSLVRQMEQKKLPRRSVVVTFDDGYADNFTTALPLLQKWQIPATIFVTTQNIGRQKEFWWDELERIVVQTPVLPQQLSMPVGERPFSFNLKEETSLTAALQQKHRAWVATSDAPTLRTQLYLRLWEQLSPLTDPEQQQALTDLRSWAGIAEEARPAYCCMSTDQLKALATAEGITIGGHTITHPALGHHPLEQQQQEILGGKKLLEEVTPYPITLFAYPSGNYNDHSIQALKQSGFKAAFTTEHAPVSKKTEPFLISRYQVNNWSAEQFEKYLTYWFRQ
ncbi:polysaccharide deacetylase family protein [Cesiribacter sp. SM1]|uniref:polysaccharide deacetylase family protein n=1 Tax=Cesiribacter sp. SM1 TaxID=2861196 RepID=UPI001CD3CFB8|nr:polysaccharide deacetylase family protein [Cesiribacter sp. SM1]